MLKHIAAALFSICFVLVLGGASAVRAQSVPASFFGASSDVCVSALVSTCTLGSGGTGLYPVWWPGSNSDTSPAGIPIGAAGKPVAMGWGMAEIDVTSLYIAPSSGTDGSTIGTHWRSCLFDAVGAGTCPSGFTSATAGSYWPEINSYVKAAQSTSTPVTYTFYYVPQYSVCYDYSGTGDSSQFYYGGPKGSVLDNENPNAISCSASSASAPYNTIYGTDTGTTPGLADGDAFEGPSLA